MTRVRCYGLDIETEVELPDLVTAAPGAAPPDVTIRRARLGDPPAGAAHLPLGLWRSGATVGFTVPGTGSFVVRDGREVVVDVAPEADDRAVRQYLLGTAMGSLMMQRGHLVLHGNAFRVGDACAVVVGRSGAGKSTLAAELLGRGYDVLADDVVPVDPQGRAVPGHPRIKLWHDAVERLGLDPADLDRVTTSIEKFQLPISRAALEPLPLRWVYVLERHDGEDLHTSEVGGMEAFALLHEHTYRNELVHGPGAVAEHLAQCARLAGTARISRVTRPAATMTAESTTDAILSDIMESPTIQESA